MENHQVLDQHLFDPAYQDELYYEDNTDVCKGCYERFDMGEMVRLTCKYTGKIERYCRECIEAIVEEDLL